MGFKKILNIFALVFFIAFSILFCFTQFKNTPLISKNNKALTIYEWWHIESFEGGGTNRQNYLNQLCIEYEKQSPTTIFMVRLIAAEQLESALAQNIPHLISFSEQVAKIVMPYLKEFKSEYKIQDNFLESAKYNGKLMALPFIASGYCYFSKTNSKSDLKLYTANNNSHSAAQLVKGLQINSGETLSSYQCYTKFVNSNNIKLLGTARDLFRIKNLESLGRFSVNYEPVSTFSDLIQYLGITSTDNEIMNFVNFVISDTNQLKLSNLNLFTTKHLKLYTEPTYALMEQSLKSCFIPNIFNN